ncbi:MAG: PP2C family protein-serine/threonine phosphatase [Armatimonadota bacterium]
MNAPELHHQASDLDLQQAQLEWLRSLPERVRETVLRPRDITRILDRSAQVVRGAGHQALAELDAEAYRVATEMEPAVGLEATLRYLRDSLGRALRGAYAGRESEASVAIDRIITCVTDAVWRAHTDSLEETIRRQQEDRLSQELMLAKRIQERLLPRTIPQVPGFDIAGKVLAAAEVGGDYWSCKSYPEDGIVTLKLADVTGHGIAAATLVAAVKFISGGYYRGAKTAAQVMERTNHVLVKETPHEILVPMVYAWLYPYSGAMSVVNAGHSPVLHFQDGSVRRIETTGLALGLMETRYREVRLELAPGDLFFTCSDGVTAPSAEKAVGEDWVIEQVQRGRDLPAAELVEQILTNALEAYGTPQDDMSVLVVRRVS